VLSGEKVSEPFSSPTLITWVFTLPLGEGDPDVEVGDWAVTTEVKAMVAAAAAVKRVDGKCICGYCFLTMI
jgi:hypothetical protein